MNFRLVLAIYLTFFISIFQCTAQGIRGTVTDENGTVLSFATIFIKETGSGTTTNENGFYEIGAPQGTYTLVYQYLGHETKTETLQIGNTWITQDITLPFRSVELKTVEVLEGEEDPAYTVMRKAIAKASYHRQQLNSYEAEVYTKGSGRLNKTPRLLRKVLEKEGVDTSTTFVSESVSQIKYTRPNTFEEKVISIYQVGEDNDTSPNGYINSSFYEPEIGEAISPLSPKAFAYYKFKLADYFIDRGYSINKIQVIPRSPGESVFEGYIFIVEDLWSIYSTSLSTYRFGIKFQIDQIYAPIEDQVWLPVSHKFNVTGKILGFGFIYKYLATVKDYKITLNPDLKEAFVVIDEKVEKEKAKEITKEKEPTDNALERLSSGEAVTRKELRKIIREYEKEELKEQEEPEVIENYSFTVDSTARKKDSLYWASIRPVPLTQREVKGYIKMDSLAQAEKIEEADKQDGIKTGKKKNGWTPFRFITGDNYKIGEKQYFSHESLFQGILFNPVEGFSLRTNLKYSFRNKNPLLITLTPRYGFSNERFSLNASTAYTFGPKGKRSKLILNGGRYIFQYNENNPIDPYFSAFLNLVNEKNFIRLYEKAYVGLDYSKKISGKVSIAAGLEWAERNTLFNTTTQVWFGNENRSYDSNIPINEEIDLPVASQLKATTAYVSITTKPWLKYRIRNKQKTAIDDSSPTLNFTYKKGFKDLIDSEVDYDLIDFTFQHKFRMGVRNLINFKANLGWFINNDQLGFVDFKHFDGNQTILITTDPVGSFRLLDYYQFSTADKYASLHAHYQFRKFLFTQIPEVWLVGIKENLFVNYLATPKSKNYMELGYSLDNILRVFRLEAAVSFRDGKYEDFGFLIGIASNLDDLFN